jgi:hypothetical protein
MGYRIFIARGWACSHRGAAAVEYKPGEYTVPEEMPEHLAQRCLREGRGRIATDVKGPAPFNKARPRAAATK